MTPRHRSTAAVLTVLAAALPALLACGDPASTASAPADAAQDRTTHACSDSVAITGFSDVLNKTTYDGTFVGNFSALGTDSDGRVVALSDRSALFDLDGRTLQPQGVRQLHDENGQELDSEGLAVDTDGTRWISTEAEPAIRHIDPDGNVLGRLDVPAPLQVAPAGRATSNKTFEGLTLSRDHRTLLASMEGPLTGDDPDLVRFQTWQRTDPRTGFTLSRQFAYPSDPGLDVSDITAAPGDRLLVIERGFVAGTGNTIRLFVADPHDAGDTGAVENLTAENSYPARKTLLADLRDCPSLGAHAPEPQVNPLLDNIEGITVTERTSDGRLRLLLVSDDNQGDDQTTRFYFLRVEMPGAP
jgi:hypothetical protein